MAVIPVGKGATTPKTTNRGLGGILAWGLNGNAQLQVGDGVTNLTADQRVPTELSWFPLSPATNSKVVVTDAAAGGSHTLIATDDGDVYGVKRWAVGGFGCLRPPPLHAGGDVSSRARLEAERVDYEPNMGKQHVLSVAAGHEQSAAITDGGKLWMWGSDTYGQLGLG
eukprot:CAMPEP_0180217190 /NCGR_PEP_ID=MMETSP0987-20121128/16795_1 /TAXON_ID=697907 /ORGANISM="non described non described, Strain CCMP2293" /LENGTH=167 /DNA_ID=CAMNT_0022176695 /DNA_START=57 /DNA_END=561 /DNA_ORIENTATION=-